MIQTPVRYKADFIEDVDGKAIALCGDKERGEYIATCINDHARLVTENAEYAAEVERLRGALREYADESNWKQCHDGTNDFALWCKHGDGYEVAQAALEPKP